MRFNWNKPNRKRHSAVAAGKGVLFVMNCALCVLAVGTSQLAFPSCHSVYSYSLKAANGDAMRRRWGSDGYESGELQRKLVNVRLLSKAEAQLVQFSHGSSDGDGDDDSDVDSDADSKSCTGSLRDNNKKADWKDSPLFLRYTRPIGILYRLRGAG